jgi:light-regulated signal transduction histidine kinase (bacteriophytochrome)
LKDFGPQLPQEAQRLIHVVVCSAVQMTQMIDGLLKFCRLGRQALVRQPVNPTLLAEQSVKNLQRDRKGHSVEVKIAKLPDCTGDPGLLNQVFTNLLSNAFKFTNHTKNPVIEVGCEQRNGENTYFVRDNGVGFEMQYAERLFGVFQRLHPEGEFEGNGVGLSIVQRIIERHGGRIWAEAELNKGATFFFTVPNSI